VIKKASGVETMPMRVRFRLRLHRILPKTHRRLMHRFCSVCLQQKFVSKWRRKMTQKHVQKRYQGNYQHFPQCFPAFSRVFPHFPYVI
jgi:hypothetical protein